MFQRKRHQPAADNLKGGYLYAGSDASASAFRYRPIRDRHYLDRCELRLAGETTTVRVNVERCQQIIDYRNSNTRVGPSWGCSHDSYAVMDSHRLIHDIVRRCIPWADTMTVPEVWERETEAAFGGLAFDPNRIRLLPPLVVVAISRLSAFEQSIAHHEIWHAVEHALSADFIARTTAMASHKMAPTFGDPSYLDSDVERRARLYAAYASARDLGFPASPDDGSVPGCFEFVYSGRFAQHILTLEDPSIEAWMTSGRESERTKTKKLDVVM
jgi:hypothetical protein